MRHSLVEVGVESVNTRLSPLDALAPAAHKTHVVKHNMSLNRVVRKDAGVSFSCFAGGEATKRQAHSHDAAKREDTIAPSSRGMALSAPWSGEDEGRWRQKKSLLPQCHQHHRYFHCRSPATAYNHQAACVTAGRDLHVTLRCNVYICIWR